MTEIKRKSDLENAYTKGGLRKDNFFGEYFEYKAIRGSGNIICVEKLLNDKEAILREIESRKKRMLNKHEYLVNLLDYSVEVQTNWCSTFYLLKSFYEHVDKNLIAEILDRKKLSGDKNRFKMEELTHLMYQQVQANCFLQERNLHHGDISPNTVFMTPNNDFKLAFRMNDMMSPERIQMDKAIKNEPLYLSPTYYEAVKSRSLEKMKHNQHKSDMFALGLTILQSGLMRGIQDVYVGDRFDADRLNDLLDEFQASYEENPLLYTSVRKMCEVSEDERPDFISLKSALPEYETIKDYFQKVEQGIYEEDLPEEQYATDSMRNYEANFQEGEQFPNNQFQQQAFGYQEDGAHLQGQQFNNVHQIYPNPNPNMPNFSRSISNKLSSSSNPNSKENSFNKQGSFGNEFEHTAPPHANRNVNARPEQLISANQPFAQPQQPVYYHQPPTQPSGYQSGQQYGVTQDHGFNPSMPYIYDSNPNGPIEYSLNYTNNQNPSRTVQQSIDTSDDFFNFNPATIGHSFQNNVKDSHSNSLTQPTQSTFIKEEQFGDYYIPSEEKVTNANYNSPPGLVNQPVQLRTNSNPESHYLHHQQPTYAKQPQTQQYFTEPQRAHPSNPSNPVYHFIPPPAQAQVHQQYQAQPIQPSPPQYNQPYHVPNESLSLHKNPMPVSQNGPTGVTKTFNGKLYNEVKEESVATENGVSVKKVVIKYVPVDQPQPQSHQIAQTMQLPVAQHVVQQGPPPNSHPTQRFVSSPPQTTYFQQGFVAQPNVQYR
jgi:hypothetical protein